MKHPLDGCRAKVERARDLIETLKVETRTFANDNPYRTTIQVEPDSGDAVVRIWHPESEPPLRLGIHAGDVTHNLRCALDHLYYRLAELGSGPGDFTVFPLYDDATKFRKNARDLLEPLQPKHRDMIVSAQPYQKTARGWMFRLIRDVNNLDKHMVIPAVIGQAQWEPPSFSPGVLHAEVHYRDWVRVDDGAELFRIDGRTFETATPNVQVNTNTKYTLIFGDPDGVAGSSLDFGTAADEVEGLVDSLARDFG